jgi:pyruvate dehydrogenase E1 component alpha subunit
LAAFLRANGVGDDYFDSLESEADAFATTVRAACKDVTGVPLSDLFSNVYAEPHAPLALESAAHSAHLASLVSEN